jgi:GTP-binding protein
MTSVGAPRPATIAIVGRPNVGKSALFNRLVGQRRALVEEEPGTTRDRLYGSLEWLGRPLRVIDTGGIGGPDEAYVDLIRQQVDLAIAEADLVLFIVDARDGLTAPDEEVASLLRRHPGPVVLVANKADNASRAAAAVEFYELGFGEPHPISVLHLTGIDDLMDGAVGLLPARDTMEEPRGPRVAIVGRPNVGKSMLLNALAGEERVIVSDVPGTTRDSVDLAVEFEGNPLVFVDTAGIRRRGSVEPGIEKHSVLRSQAAIERCDVAILLVDATEPMTAQDLHIAGAIRDAGKGMVIAFNKWDLAKGSVSALQAEQLTRAKARFAPWAPVVTMSAKEGTGLESLLRTVLSVAAEREKRIPTAELNATIRRAVGERPLTLKNGKALKVLYSTQAQGAPPTFVFFVNDAEVHFSYRRYLENVVRRAYGFEGTAIKLVFRGRGEDREP